MNYEHINFFMTCAACLNFSLAAKHHFVSVSTLSRSLNALEDELGVKLFERGYHGHKLTEEGEVFFELCVKHSMDMSNYLMHWSNSGKDFLRIGCCPGSSSATTASTIRCSPSPGTAASWCAAQRITSPAASATVSFAPTASTASPR